VTCGGVSMLPPVPIRETVGVTADGLSCLQKACMPMNGFACDLSASFRICFMTAKPRTLVDFLNRDASIGGGPTDGRNHGADTTTGVHVFGGAFCSPPLLSPLLSSPVNPTLFTATIEPMDWDTTSRGRLIPVILQQHVTYRVCVYVYV
jgi:hypothetical protein